MQEEWRILSTTGRHVETEVQEKEVKRPDPSEPKKTLTQGEGEGEGQLLGSWSPRAGAIQMLGLFDSSISMFA